MSSVRPSAPRLGRSRASLRARCALAALLLGAGLPASAQVERYMLGPGSKVGPATKVKATDCITKPDGTVTCDTKLVNPPDDTPAKPVYSPFKN